MISLTVADRQGLESVRPATSFHGADTGFTENIAAVVQDFGRENLSSSRRSAFDERFNEQLDKARKMGIKDLPLLPQNGTPSPAELKEIMADGGRDPYFVLNRRAKQWDEFFSALKLQHPDAGFMTIADTNDDISKDFAEKRYETASIRARSTFAGDVGATLGYVTAPLQEPLVIATLPFGAAGSANILRTMLTEAVIAMGTEAAIQPSVFQFKQQIDSPYTKEDAAANVLYAGGGAALVAGTLKTLPHVFRGDPIMSGPQYRALLEQIRGKRAKGELPEPTPTQRAAENMLEQYVDELESNPNRRDQPDSLPVHADNLKAADQAAARGEGLSPDEVKTTRTMDPERRQDVAQRQKVNTLRQQIQEMTAKVERGEAKPKELTKLMRDLDEAIYTDALTQIPNRRSWDEAEKKPFVAAIDLDGFKIINDEMGHGVGDEALQIVARILKEETGDAYRYGGDEFTAQAGKGAALEKALKRAEERLKNEKLEVIYPDGSKDTKHGIELTYAIDRSYKDADLKTKATKDARRAARKAAGGASPGLVRTPAPGNTGGLNRGAPDRAAAPVPSPSRNQGLARQTAEEFDSNPEATTEVLQAEVERVLAENPNLMVPDADGKPIPIKQMLDELQEDDAALSVVNACLKGPV